MSAVLLALLIGFAEALLTNTDWRVGLSIGDRVPSSRGRLLPLPVALRFAGDDLAVRVDRLLHSPKRLEALTDTAPIVTMEGQRDVPVYAIGWTENPVERHKSMVTWCIEFPEGAERGAAKLPPGRVYCSAELWEAADLGAKQRALARLQESMTSLEANLSQWRGGEGLIGLLGQLADRRRLDEKIVALEEQVPGSEVIPIPGAAGAVITRQGTLSARREGSNSIAGRLSSLVGGSSSAFVEIGTFSLQAMPSPPQTQQHTRLRPPHTTAAVAPRAHAPSMGLFDSLPGFWRAAVPEGYARASHILFIGSGEEVEQTADAVLERIREGRLSFPQAARQYSYCPTRDQEPAGDLGTFASLSCMASVDEMRSFDGVMELPYEGQDTRAFDDVIFSAPLNQPVKVTSQWGVHIVLVTERGDGERAIIAPDAPSAFCATTAQNKNDAGRSL